MYHECKNHFQTFKRNILSLLYSLVMTKHGKDPLISESMNHASFAHGQADKLAMQCSTNNGKWPAINAMVAFDDYTSIPHIDIIYILFWCPEH